MGFDSDKCAYCDEYLGNHNMVNECMYIKLKEENKLLREAVEFYAKTNKIPKHISEHSCTIKYCEDSGNFARKTLKEIDNDR